MIQATLLICAVLAALLVLRYDMFDREPPWLLALVALVGALALSPVARLEEIVIRAPTSLPPSWWIATVAAVCEESLRVLIVVGVARLVPRWFNDAMDSIVYGSVVGLGMAFAEALPHLDEALAGTWAPPPAEIVRLLGHLVLGGIACSGVQHREGTFGQGRHLLLYGWSLAVLLHFVVDLAGLWMAIGRITPRRAAFYHVIAMLLGLAIYGGLVAIAFERSRRRFRPWSTRRLLGWPFRRRS